MVAVPVRLLQFSVTTKMLCLRSDIYTVTVSGEHGIRGRIGPSGPPAIFRLEDCFRIKEGKLLKCVKNEKICIVCKF